MKIRMNATAPGSVDGIRVTTYQAGLEYDLTATAGERDLAESFVGAGMAVEIGVAPVAEEPIVEPSEQAVVTEATVLGKPGRKAK